MTTLTLQPNETDGYDTSLSQINPNTNYGGDALLYIGESNVATNKRRGLIKFDLSSIPSNAIISSVVLSLWVVADVSSNARDYKLYRVLRDWVETQATWNIWKTSNNWTTAGCGSDGNDADLSTVWATCSFTATETDNTEKQFVLDATGLAEFTKWVDGTNPNYGWLIKPDTELNDGYNMDSSSSATAEQRPKLVVTYTAGGGEFFLVL